MKKILSIALIAASAFAGFGTSSEVAKLKEQIKDLQSQIDELYERVDENELAASLNKIKWGGELEVNVGNYYGKRNGDKYGNLNKWDLRLKLNMEAKINEKTKFTGRLMMTKAFADSTPVAQAYLDSEEGRVDTDAKLYVERAYVDYKFTPNFIMTIGRQPSSDGPGMSLKYDTPRKSTYPALLFNGSADGIVFTYKSKIATFRAAYGKGYQYDSINYHYLTDNNGLKDTDVFGFFAERKIVPEKIGDNLVIFSAVKSIHISPFNGESLGSYDHLGLYFENNKAFKSNFNYFISLAYANPHSNGKTSLLAIDANDDGQPDMAIPVQLNKKDGYAYHIGMRYDFKKIKLGYEFNHGSKYWFAYTANYQDPQNKLAVRGNVHDVYAIYRFDMFQYIRCGFTYADLNYNFEGLPFAPNGEPQKVNDNYKTVYLNYDVRF